MYFDRHRNEYMTPNRSFNPRAGRWTQPDPFWNIHNMQGSPAAIAQSSNLFLFTMHNPVRWVDPTGLFAQLPHFNFGISIWLNNSVFIGKTKNMRYNTDIEALVSSGSGGARPGTNASGGGGSGHNVRTVPNTNAQNTPRILNTQSSNNTSRLRAPSATVESFLEKRFGIKPRTSNQVVQSNVSNNVTASNPPRLTTVTEINVITGTNIPDRHGTANSITRLVDSNNNVIQERHFGPDRRALFDVDFRHPTNHGLAPGQGHIHIWDWDAPPGANPRPFWGPLP